MTRDTDRQLNEVVQRTQARIRAHIAGMGIPPHVVDDVAQEVYLEVRRGMHKLPEDADGEIRWLKGIARRVSLNHLRRTKRRHRQHEEAVQELLVRAETPFDSSPAVALKEALRACMAKLRQIDRDLLRERYEEDRDYADLAHRTRRSESALRVHLHRLRQNLRHCIRITLGEVAE